MYTQLAGIFLRCKCRRIDLRRMIMTQEQKAIQQDNELLETDVDPNPFVQFHHWFEEAFARITEANAMTLATASTEGAPSARMVLLKEFDERGFVFFTNYESRKGRELEANPVASLVFWWKELQRQVRIEGWVKKVESYESDRYFQSRPRGSRLGAWASPQSGIVSSREELDVRYREVESEYQGREIPRPPYWGGYRVVPKSIEFWQGRTNRLHDRLRYRREEGDWILERLAP